MDLMREPVVTPLSPNFDGVLEYGRYHHIINSLSYYPVNINKPLYIPKNIIEIRDLTDDSIKDFISEINLREFKKFLETCDEKFRSSINFPYDALEIAIWMNPTAPLHELFIAVLYLKNIIINTFDMNRKLDINENYNTLLSLLKILSKTDGKIYYNKGKYSIDNKYIHLLDYSCVNERNNILCVQY